MNTVPIQSYSSGKRGRGGLSFARGFRRGRGGISGSELKLLAVILMTLDHIGLTLVEQGALGGGLETAPAVWWYVDLLLQGLGRLAFPIFAFFVAEGAFYTRHKKEYGLRLLIFALISEIPFDLAIFGQPVYLGCQNVMFTFLLAYISILGIQKNARRPVLKVLCGAAGCAAGAVFQTDYGAVGVLMVILLYLLKGSSFRTLAGVIVAGLDSIGWFGLAALAFVPLHFYHEERGRFPGKYFFYCYYPAHLLVLFLLLRIIFR